MMCAFKDAPPAAKGREEGSTRYTKLLVKDLSRGKGKLWGRSPANDDEQNVSITALKDAFFSVPIKSKKTEEHHS